jgi:3-oxoacyl-[acyl-carrier-protein] synthase I
MNLKQLSIDNVGLVTAVGLGAEACCAAFRAKVTNPARTNFLGSDGEFLTGHLVELDEPLIGMDRLSKMASMAISEALGGIHVSRWNKIPLLLCVAEPGRPGRREGLDDDLISMIRSELGVSFSHRSVVVAHGRVAAAVALSHARMLLNEPGVEKVLVAASDSLLSAATLHHYGEQDRLLTDENSNGFIAGEGAGALLLSHRVEPGALVCTGIGFGREPSIIESDMPLRADGLAQAIRAALADAQCDLGDIDFRVTDIAGEHYYFKEASLALLRSLRHRKEEFDLWHPAECTGEIGAAAGIAALASAWAACRKGYAKGSGILIHLSNDDGSRAALTLRNLATR